MYRRIEPRDASFWANFCGVFYSNDHVANYMQIHMVTAEIRYVRDNFFAARKFADLDDLG